MNGAVEHWSWLTSAKPAIAAGVLVLLWLIESIAPLVAERRRRISHDAANVLLGMINAAVVTVLFGVAMLFGTFRLRDDPGTIELGLDDDQSEQQWRTLIGMLTRPFRQPSRRDPQS